MENSCDWHGKAPKKEEYEVAMADLAAIAAALDKEDSVLKIGMPEEAKSPTAFDAGCFKCLRRQRRDRLLA